MSTLINSTSLGNIIIVTGSFLLLLVLVKLFAWDQITGIFKAREEAEDLAAKRQRELAGARLEATQIIDDAKETGKNQEAKIVAQAHEEAKRLKEKANQDIALSKVEALSSVKGDVADLTVMLAEKIMATTLDKEAQSDLIDSYLDKLGDA